ncbi:Lachesin [Araneus ventricosus]|uniref:Lachesin n=1 Tax=Araneus ventricosus TaxID=182803 RepID=A0A4Y2D3D0_ARAVE|nr:Lachesin [Araneus ventricosus]
MRRDKTTFDKRLLFEEESSFLGILALTGCVKAVIDTSSQMQVEPKGSILVPPKVEWLEWERVELKIQLPPRGLPGPRGKKGVPGKAGTPGVPGIKAWSVNGSEIKDVKDLLIPPSIVDIEPVTTLIVDEGHRVKLECHATGKPQPVYTWRSDENKSIRLKKWLQSAVNSSHLEIQQVSRDQMGVYLCVASNGVPPPAFKKIKLEVTFPPLIKIRNQMVGTVNGSYALLECFVEAHPPAVNFWIHGESRHLENNWKYKIDQIDDGYRTHMVLNITRVEPLDYGLYRCVSKNDKGKTQGVFTVFEIDPNTPTRQPPVETFEVYGQQPPPSALEPMDCEPCVTKCDPVPLCPTTGGHFITVRVILNCGQMTRAATESVFTSQNFRSTQPGKDLNLDRFNVYKYVLFPRSRAEILGSEAEILTRGTPRAPANEE